MNKNKLPFLVKLVAFFGRPIVHKTKFHYSEKLSNKAIIITNHNSTFGPLNWSFYFPYEASYWGGYRYFENRQLAYETTYQEFLANWKPKKAKRRAKISAKLLEKGYKGGHIIKVYDDLRFYNTIKESILHYEKDRFIVIFADDPANLHTNEIKTLMPGVLTLIHAMEDENPDIILAHLDDKGRNIYLDKPHKFDDFKEKYKTDQEILLYFKERINNLKNDFK